MTPVSFEALTDFYQKEVRPLNSVTPCGDKLSSEALNNIYNLVIKIQDYLHQREANHNNIVESDHVQMLKELKRFCVLRYQTVYLDTQKLYRELCKSPIDLIDNGKFELELRKLFNEILPIARNRRKSFPQQPSFDDWKKVYINCTKIKHLESVGHSNIEWAKNKRKLFRKLAIVLFFLNVLYFLLNLFASLVSVGLLPRLNEWWLR